MTTEFTIQISKAAQAVVIDFDAMPADVQAHIVEYGLRQKLNDRLSDMSAAKGHSPADMMTEVNELIAAMMAGEVTMRAGRTADPVAKQAHTIGIDRARSAMRKAKGLWTERASAKGMKLEEFIRAVGKQLASTDEVRALAAKQVAESAGEGGAVDLSTLI